MKPTLFFIAFVLVANAAQAQIQNNDPCAYDFNTIVCKYDDNGNRIFRGFALECPPDDRPASNNPLVTKKVNINNGATATTAQLYPNPTVAETTLSFAEMPPAGAILYVYDTQGKILIEQYADQQQMRISLAPFPAGVYLMVVIHQKQVFYSGKISKME